VYCPSAADIIYDLQITHVSCVKGRRQMCIDRLCFFYIELNFIGAICCSMAILIVNLIPLSLEEVAFNWNIDICRSHSNS